MKLRELLACFAAPWSSISGRHDDESDRQRDGQEKRKKKQQQKDEQTDGGGSAAAVSRLEDAVQQQEQQVEGEPAPVSAAAPPSSSTPDTATVLSTVAVEGASGGAAAGASSSVVEEEEGLPDAAPAPHRADEEGITEGGAEPHLAPASIQAEETIPTVAPASPSSVSSAGSSFRASSSSLSGRRSGTPTGSKAKMVKGTDGRARRVAMIEEEGGDGQQPQQRPGSREAEGDESLEVALDRCLAERHSEPAAAPRPKKKTKKKRRSASVASSSSQGLEEVEGRLGVMREELLALEARLAAARAEVAAVEGTKSATATGDGAAVYSAASAETEQPQAEEGGAVLPEVGEEGGMEGQEQQQEEEEDEDEEELVQLHLRESAMGVEEEAADEDDGEQPKEEEGEEMPAQATIDPPVADAPADGAPVPKGLGAEENVGGAAEPSGASASKSRATATSSTSTTTTTATTSQNNMRRFLSLADLDSLRSFLLDHQVFGSITGATSSLRQAFEIDPARSVFQSLTLPQPEKLLHLYKERVLADARRKSGRYQDILPVEMMVLIAVTDRHVYVIDPSFAAPNPSGHMKHFSEAPPPLLLARHPLRALDRVVVGFRGQWGRLVFDMTAEAAAAQSSVRGRVPSSSPSPLMRQGLSLSPTLSAFGDAMESEDEEEGDGGSGNRTCQLLQDGEDPVVAVGYTLITRDKAQTFRILNAELRPLANEARTGRGGSAGAGASSRLSASACSAAAAVMRERALSASGGAGSKGKVAIVNAEEEALAALEGVGGLRYFEMVYQWSRKRSQLLPRTVMVTEDGELLIAVEDLRQDPSLPLPQTSSGAELERGGSADSQGASSSSASFGLRPDKFSPVPASGEKMTLLLRAPVADVVEVQEEARDPRYITLTVREPNPFFLPFKRAHTWRLYSENRLQIDGLLKILRSGMGGGGL